MVELSSLQMATTNPAHLARYIDARQRTDI